VDWHDLVGWEGEKSFTRSRRVSLASACDDAPVMTTFPQSFPGVPGRSHSFKLDRNLACTCTEYRSPNQSSCKPKSRTWRDGEVGSVARRKKERNGCPVWLLQLDMASGLSIPKEEISPRLGLDAIDPNRLQDTFFSSPPLAPSSLSLFAPNKPGKRTPLDLHRVAPSQEVTSRQAPSHPICLTFWLLCTP
jgi:hypothetical protein